MVKIIAHRINKVNQLKEKSVTKDGLHMIIGLQMSHAGQMELRKRVVKEISNIWDDLPITNTWDKVLDEGISEGKTNWQMFGSRKPGHQSYELKTKFIGTYNSTNSCWDLEKCNGKHGIPLILNRTSKEIMCCH